MTEDNKSDAPSTSLEILDPRRIEGASDHALLLHALAFDDEDPLLGAFEASSRESRVLGNLLEAAGPGADLDLGDLGAVIEGYARRLDVTIELLRRRSAACRSAA